MISRVFRRGLKLAQKPNHSQIDWHLPSEVEDNRLFRCISSRKQKTPEKSTKSDYVDLQTILSGTLPPKSTTKQAKAAKNKPESLGNPTEARELPKIVPLAPDIPMDLARRYHSTISSLSSPARIYSYLFNNRETTSAHLVTAVHRILALRGLSKLQISLLGRKTEPNQPKESQDEDKALEEVEQHPTSSKSSKDNPNPWKDPRFIFLLESISQDLESMRAQDLTKLIGCLTAHQMARKLQIVQKLLVQVAEYVRIVFHLDRTRVDCPSTQLRRLVVQNHQNFQADPRIGRYGGFPRNHQSHSGQVVQGRKEQGQKHEQQRHEGYGCFGTQVPHQRQEVCV